MLKGRAGRVIHGPPLVIRSCQKLSGGMSAASAIGDGDAI